jgi:hypothetical protein
MKDSSLSKEGGIMDINSMGIFTSCIFHNFYNVVRAGANSTIAL